MRPGFPRERRPGGEDLLETILSDFHCTAEPLEEMWLERRDRDPAIARPIEAVPREPSAEHTAWRSQSIPKWSRDRKSVV
jgi:hypothetical protein